MNLMIDRKNHLNNGRINAFLHRITTTAVRMNTGRDSSHFVLPLLLVVRQMIIHHRFGSHLLLFNPNIPIEGDFSGINPFILDVLERVWMMKQN